MSGGASGGRKADKPLIIVNDHHGASEGVEAESQAWQPENTVIRQKERRSTTPENERRSAGPASARIEDLRKLPH